MVSRTVLALFAVAFVAVLASAAPAEEPVVDVDDFDDEEDFEREGLKEWASEQAKKAGKELVMKVVEYLKKKAKNVNLDCFKEIFDHCSINPILHPQKYYRCAKGYIVEHMDHCYHDKE